MRKILLFLMIFSLSVNVAACSTTSSTNSGFLMTPSSTADVKELSTIGAGSSMPTEPKMTPFIGRTMTPYLTRVLPTLLPTSTPVIPKNNQPISTENHVGESTLQKLGVIMVWNGLTEKTSIYGYFDPEIEMQIDINRLKAPVDSFAPDPSRSITLSFSPYTDKIAYFTKDNGIELWISGLELTNIKQAWKDDNNWLGNIRGKFDVLVTWGINDRYLIISSALEDHHLLVFDLIADESWEILGKCNWIIKSPMSNQLVIGCTSEQQDQEDFMLLDTNGIVNLNSSVQPLIERVLSYSYSKDATRILFISEDKKFGILDSDGKINYLPLTFEMNASLDLTWRKNLQWSQDGSRVLVYGFEPSPKLCPLQLNAAAQNRYTPRSCWFVLDSSTSEIVWWPKDNISSTVGIPWDYLRNEYDASLSPDGERLTSTFTDIRMGNAYYLLSVSLLNDEVKIIALEQAHTIFWP